MHRACRTRSGTARSSPGAPHREEGCRPASRGYALELMTLATNIRPPARRGAALSGLWTVTSDGTSALGVRPQGGQRSGTGTRPDGQVEHAVEQTREPVGLDRQRPFQRRPCQGAVSTPPGNVREDRQHGCGLGVGHDSAQVRQSRLEAPAATTEARSGGVRPTPAPAGSSGGGRRGRHQGCRGEGCPGRARR